MRFYAKASNFRVQLAPGGMKPDPFNPDTYNPVAGDYAQFEGGQYDTSRYFGSLSEEQVIAKLRGHRSYGYPNTPPRIPGQTDANQFWSEEDRPESVRMEDELAQLRVKVAEYEKLSDQRVVIVEKAPVHETDKDEHETGLQKLNRLKKEALEKGVAIERGWKAEDYERVLATKE